MRDGTDASVGARADVEVDGWGAIESTFAVSAAGGGVFAGACVGTAAGAGGVGTRAVGGAGAAVVTGGSVEAGACVESGGAF